MSDRSARAVAEQVRRHLPAGLRRRLGQAGRFLAYDQGYPSLAGSLRILRDWGYRPRAVVDGGAFEGSWIQAFREFFPSAPALLVEPQSSKQSLLRAQAAAATDDGVATFVSDALLGPVDGQEVDFHEMQTGSSVFSELTAHPRRTSRRTTTSLDTVVRGFPDLPAPDFVKLDVQGYELQVLDGAAATMEATWFLFVEASLAPYNEGAPLLPEVIGFLADHRFMPIDICAQMRRTDGLLRQIDLLAMRDSCPFVEPWRRRDA